MDVVYPHADGHAPGPHEHPVRSVAFPWYQGYRLGAPKIPDALGEVDVVHAHTPYALGLGAMRLARRADAPLVASYHTPTDEYADYLAPGPRTASGLGRISRRFGQARTGKSDSRRVSIQQRHTY